MGKCLTISRDEQKYRELKELQLGREQTNMNEKIKRSLELDDQNQVMLDRLLKIKNQRGALSKDVSKPRQGIHGQQQLKIKKKEAKRIDLENQRLLSKIMTLVP